MCDDRNALPFVILLEKSEEVGYALLDVTIAFAIGEWFMDVRFFLDLKRSAV